MSPGEAGRFAAMSMASYGAEIVVLARHLLRRDEAPVPVIVTVPVLRSDAEKAGGVEIVRHTIAAVAPPDGPELPAKAADVIAALKALAPQTPAEAASAGLLVAMDAVALDSLAVARIAGFGTMLGVTLLGRAEKLACRANELAEALARRGNRGPQRIVVEHVTIEKGANAVIGSVAAGTDADDAR